jgi:hypothetical protein
MTAIATAEPNAIFVPACPMADGLARIFMRALPTEIASLLIFILFTFQYIVFVGLGFRDQLWFGRPDQRCGADRDA